MFRYDLAATYYQEVGVKEFLTLPAPIPDEESKLT